MPIHHPLFWPVVAAVASVYLVYRRIRRNFGRQPVRPVRLVLRLGLLTVLAAVLAPLAARSSAFLLAEAAGLAAGLALAAWGASQTRFEIHEGTLNYLPHTRTGLAVSLLVLGRLVYRVVELERSGASGPDFTSSQTVESPLTAGFFFVLIGYYVAYYGFVLWAARQRRAGDPSAPPTPWLK